MFQITNKIIYKEKTCANKRDTSINKNEIHIFPNKKIPRTYALQRFPKLDELGFSRRNEVTKESAIRKSIINGLIWS